MMKTIIFFFGTYFMQISAEAAPPSLLKIPEGSVLTAHFRQERFLKALPTPLVQEGKMMIWQGHGVLWETYSPFPNTLLFTKKGIFTLNNGQKKSLTGKQDKKPHEDKILSLLSHLLTGDFQEIEGFKTSPSSSATRQELIALPPLSAFLSKVDVTLSKEGHLSKLIVIRANGDRNEIHFSHHKVGSAQKLTNDQRSFLQ